MSKGLKPVGFQKASVVAICAKAELMAMVITLHDGRCSQLLGSDDFVLALW